MARKPVVNPDKSPNTGSCPPVMLWLSSADPFSVLESRFPTVITVYSEENVGRILMNRCFRPKDIAVSATAVSTLPPQQHVHTVQFYRADESLLHELNTYIGSALSQYCSAIVIATSGHLASLAKKLNSAGIDTANATEEGRYIALDASEVLSRFTANGQPDPICFSEVVGGMIARAADASRQPGRRVVAFGEMVALLWAEGRTESALELEKLWNDLARRHSFALHCAYPLQGFMQQDIPDSLLKICNAHTDVVSSEMESEDLKHLATQVQKQHSKAFLLRRQYGFLNRDYRSEIASINTRGDIKHSNKMVIMSEIDHLAGLQKKAMELAIYVGMSAGAWGEYDKRRERIAKLMQQLGNSENSQ